MTKKEYVEFVKTGSKVKVAKKPKPSKRKVKKSPKENRVEVGWREYKPAREKVTFYKVNKKS
jgi:hypothetical protein